jgi:chromosome segregation ATPase
LVVEFEVDMTDTPLAEQIREIMRAELAPIRAQLEGQRSQLDGLRAEQASMRTQLDAMRAEQAPMRAQLDGLPLINRTVTVIQQEVRSLRAAFNDFSLTNPTVGEIEALHTDVNRVQAENAELAARVMTLERLVRELGESRSAARG